MHCSALGTRAVVCSPADQEQGGPSTHDVLILLQDVKASRVLMSPILVMCSLYSIEVPDWGRRGVRPKRVPTIRDGAKREGSSIATLNDGAAIGPTPGTTIKWWAYGVVNDHLRDDFV